MSKFTFTNAPVLKRGRSRFDLSHNVFTTGSLGRLYPFLVQEVYPADQFRIKQTGVFRTSVPFIRPIFDNIYVDFSYFFVPYRLLASEWEDCITGGSGNPQEWVDPEETDLPTYPQGNNVTAKSLLDYLGYVPNKSVKGLSLLPARAVAKIWNDWFRDENVDLPCNLPKSGKLTGESPNANAWGPSNWNGECPPVSKFHDYFTSCLRKTQKGNNVEIPFTGNLTGNFNVTGATSMHSLINNLKFGTVNGIGGTLVAGSDASGSNVTCGAAANQGSQVNRTNLVTNIVNAPVDIDVFGVNEMRYAFALQRILERAARSGSRYTEMIHSSFGVTSPDARLQRSEYLGGSRTPINVQQVAQTSASSGDNKLAGLGAFSLTNNKSGMSKAFVEHGYIIGLFCLRQSHTYQQGIEKFLTRVSRYDFYDPALQNIGEVPVYTGELFRNGQDQGSVFGYQEAWADLRCRQNRITGQMRSSIGGDSYDVYHLGDDYASVPTLSADFIHETRIYVDRALGLVSEGDFEIDPDQFLIDIHLDIKAIRVLPTYSVPSLIDHN